MKKVISYVCEHPEEYKWEQADKSSGGHIVFHATDIYIPLPGWERVRRHRITTLRRKIYRICGMITGNGWYRHIVYQTDDVFQRIIEQIQAALIWFRYRYGTG